jgi:integrase/recombinase XerC
MFRGLNEEKTLRTIKHDVEKEWIRGFLRDLKTKDYSSVTVKGYTQDVNLFLEWYTAARGPVFLEKIIGFDLMIYRKHLLSDKKYKGSTINRKIQALRKFFRWAHNVGLIKTEISLEARFVRTSKRHRPMHLNRREINALLRAASGTRSFVGTRNFVIVQLFLQTGIRVAEMAGLTISDVTISDRSGILMIRNGKGGKEREIPLNKSARLALSTHLQALGEITSPDLQLFQSERRTSLSRRSIQDIIFQTAKRAEIKRISVSAHTLRHTFAMNYMSANPGKLVELANLLGHESLDTTSIYLRPSKEDLAEDLERMT